MVARLRYRSIISFLCASDIRAEKSDAMAGGGGRGLAEVLSATSRPDEAAVDANAPGEEQGRARASTGVTVGFGLPLEPRENRPLGHGA